MTQYIITKENQSHYLPRLGGENDYAILAAAQYSPSTIYPP